MPGRIVAQKLGESLEAYEARRTACAGVRPLQQPLVAPTADDGAPEAGESFIDKVLNAVAPGQRAMRGWVGGSLAGLVGALRDDSEAWLRLAAMPFIVCVLWVGRGMLRDFLNFVSALSCLATHRPHECRSSFLLRPLVRALLGDAQKKRAPTLVWGRVVRWSGRQKPRPPPRNPGCMPYKEGIARIWDSIPGGRQGYL